MPAGHPLIEDQAGGIPSTFSVGASASALGAQVSGGAGAGPAEGEHNTHLWVAGIVGFALIGLILLHVTGFRFSTDVGVTRG